MLNLDTHILLFALRGDVTADEQRILTANRWGISAIVLWEITKLFDKRRITVSLDDFRLTALIDRVHIWPIDSPVCRNIIKLDFRSDPADELIAATSLTYDVPLLTRDAKMRASKVVRCV